MQFWELINRSNFLKDKFKNIEDHFDVLERYKKSQSQLNVN